jgi:GTPase SAR1 family protein
MTDTAAQQPDAAEVPFFRIGMLGPSRVGKTSVVISLLTDAEATLAGTPVSLRAADEATAERVRKRRLELEGGVLAGHFNSRVMPGNQTHNYFHLELRAGSRNPELLRLSLLDFPGGWMHRRDQMSDADRKDWDECHDFLVDSNILIVPVDATVLMEASESAHWQSVPEVLETVTVSEIIQDWAASRFQNNREPAMVIFAPIKCERYFSDNHGFRDASRELRERFLRVYGRMIELIRIKAPHALIRYSPIDTLGCVELVSAKWTADESAPDVLRPEGTFTVRIGQGISVKGADNVLRDLCEVLTESRRRVVDELQRSTQDEKTRIDDLLSVYRGSLARQIGHWISGDIRRATRGSLDKGARLDQLDMAKSQLEEATESLAKGGRSDRWGVL